ncbi:UPF3 domain-containing protein [Caenorhabditis elegans]|uniref:UPF3 domain-containing protein n=1 Tax=Caenorhabditis elegans TaxID=6239 RepID=Q20445_CAEEL|nr:UPF3 domain-containing protein [Caenorhabditis elegans]CAA94820.2 UPF3 domain-containing protein [Caenorhabditis elegans]|eukprot:NP_741601.1 Suppressor with Morphological effect on Genitalia [Caenorhabditis elegans]
MTDSKDGHVKVVLRRLPKYMTEHEVLEQISPLPEEVIGTYFHPANFSFDRCAYATLTVNFSEYCDSMMEFERRFDGYIFVDSRGNDSAAVVEAASNQNFAKCDRNRMKEDTRVGAILTDKYYLDFCKKLEEERAIPILTLEQQIRKLNQPDDARTQIDKMETPLVKYFFEKETGKRRDYDARRQRRDEKRAEKRDKVDKFEKHKNVLDILMKPSVPMASTSATTSKKDLKKEKPMTEKEKERWEKQDAKRKERNMIRKQKFLDEKKKKHEEREQDGPRVPRDKKKERLAKPPRPSPAKTVGEQQGEDWIKKLTDPKSAPMKKKHDSPPN